MDLREILCYCDAANRVSTFTASFLVANTVNGCVVETGTSHMAHSNGNSTIMLAEFAKQKGVEFYSVDINPKAIEIAKEIVGNRKVNFVRADSKEWLASFNEPIALCYLDSLDYDYADPDPCQVHQLNEFMAVEQKIVKGGALLLDDAALPGGGKCGRTAAHILQIGGWILLNNEYQLLYVKE